MKIQVYILLINLLFLTEVFGQSLKLDDAFELINSTPSKMTVKLANNNWKFFDAKKEMSDDGTLSIHEEITFHYYNKIDKSRTGTFVYKKTMSIDMRKDIGNYAKVYYSFIDTEILNNLIYALDKKGLKIKQDEVLQTGQIVKSYRHNDYNIALLTTASNQGQVYTLFLETKYTVD